MRKINCEKKKIWLLRLLLLLVLLMAFARILFA